MPKISPEKKKEYNQRYRNKTKNNDDRIEEIEEEKPEEIEKIEVKPVEIEETHEEKNEKDGKTYEMDEETYNYLLSCAMNKKEEAKPEQPKKEDNGFFFLLKNQMKQQVIITCATVLPIVAGKLLMNGMNSLGNSWKLPTLNYTKNINPKSSTEENQPLDLSEFKPMNY